MRLGIISRCLDREIWAAARYTKNLIEKLFDVDGSLQIYLIHNKKNKDYIYKKCNELLLPDIRLPRFSNSIFDLILYRQSLKYKFDILHYPGGEISPLFWLAHSKKKVVTIHAAPQASLPKTLYKPHSIFHPPMLKYLNNNMDAIITVSEVAREEIINSYGIDKDKIHVIYHGIEESFKPLTNMAAVRIDLKEKYKIDAPYILHVSNYQPIKNGPNIVRAFYILKKDGLKHKLVFAGAVYWGFRDVLKVIRELGLEKEVIITGHVAEDLVKLYNGASLFVSPSFHESFGLTLLEAMACGTPVVTSDASYVPSFIPELVDDAAVMVNPFDVEGMAKAIYNVISNTELNERLRRKGLERAREFSWEKCARKHLNLYKNLLK